MMFAGHSYNEDGEESNSWQRYDAFRITSGLNICSARMIFICRQTKTATISNYKASRKWIESFILFVCWEGGGVCVCVCVCVSVPHLKVRECRRFLHR
jgi:hypothetical protein